MALNVWNQSSGYSFGLRQERTKLALDLPVITSEGIAFNVISGTLPPGLRISGHQIVGTPFEVPRTTTYRFCVRASASGEISDRTFTIDIAGPDEPTFLTAEGDLPAGPSNSYFVLDASYIEFQIDAVDFDTASGQKLHYFIADDDGELPPGLSLSDDGLISGFATPSLSIKISDGTGAYDNGYYDGVVYDFGTRPSNGFASFLYDQITYDYSTPTNPPKKVNRNYEFYISLTDGDTVARRRYRMFVVADDFFRADNTFLPAGTGVYKADGTFLRSPVWKTPEYLGIVRANNYVTKILDTYETGDSTLVLYEIVSGSLPPGMEFDISTSEIFGNVPYQPAVTKRYSFTVAATRFTPQISETTVTNRTFYIDVQGEVDSVITWETDANLGIIPANFISNLHITANTTIENALLVYTVESGRLPPGLTLMPDGEIVGKVNQYGTPVNLGLTRFYDEDAGVNSTTTTILSQTLTPAFGSINVFTATVNPATATGRVAFKDGNTIIGYGILSNGVTQFVYSSLSLGTHKVKATYQGDGVYSSSSSSALTLVVGLAPTYITLVVDNTSVVYGTFINLSATINSPSGLVSGNIIFKNGSNVIGVGTIINSQATLSLGSLPVASNTLTAEFLGSANFDLSISNSVTVEVSAVTGTTPSLISLGFNTLIPSYKSVFEITATIIPNDATGTVIFLSDGSIIGSVAVSNGQAMLSTSSLTGGPHSITAVYTGNSTYAGSTSGSSPIEVIKLDTAVEFESSAYEPRYGEGFILSAQITTSIGIPTGTVTFYDGLVDIGMSTLVGGVALFNVSNRTTVGIHSFSAEYSGDQNYSSSSTPITLNVKVLESIVEYSANSISGSATSLELGGVRPVQYNQWTINGNELKFQGTGLPYHSYGNVTSINDPVVQEYNLTLPYRAGTKLQGNDTPIGLGIIGLSLNGVAIFSPNAGDVVPLGYVAVPGFHYNVSSEQGSIVNYSLGEDHAGGATSANGIYHYRDGNFFDSWYTGEGENNSVPETSLGFADNLIIPYLNNGLFHPNGHSKILGFAADGYPIYGPYGFSVATTSASVTRRMTTGYRLKNVSSRIGTAAEDIELYPMGIFVEDFEYASSPPSDLDEHNGRYCVTPEFPNGTYAYFITVDSQNNPVYPYIIGNTFYGTPTDLGGAP
jgi:hypothetical protein